MFPEEEDLQDGQLWVLVGSSVTCGKIEVIEETDSSCPSNYDGKLRITVFVVRGDWGFRSPEK